MTEATLGYRAILESNDVQRLSTFFNSENVNSLDTDGYPPLFFACMKKGVSLSTITALMQRGATVDAASADGETPLYIACFNNRMDVAKLLLERGAAVDRPCGMFRETVLHVAARFEYIDLLKALIKKGAAMEARNATGETPLCIAARTNHHASVAVLLEAGAEKLAKDADGNTPLYIASEKGYKEVVLVLKANKEHLAAAKVEADKMRSSRDPPVPSTMEIAERLVAEERVVGKRRASQPTAKPNTTPMEVVPIHVPQPKKRTADPFSGASYGPCRSLEEVGYDEPAEVPANLKNRPPPKPQRIGGTLFRVPIGSSTEAVEPFRVGGGLEDAVTYATA